MCCVGLSCEAVSLFMCSLYAMLVGGLNDVVVGAKQDKVQDVQ